MLLFTVLWCVQMLALRHQAPRVCKTWFETIIAEIDFALRETPRCLRTAYKCNAQLPVPVRCAIPEAGLGTDTFSLGGKRIIN